MFLAEQVINEIHDNIQAVQDDSGRKVFELDAMIRRTTDVLSSHGIPVLLGPALESYGFPLVARTLVDRFMSVSVSIHDDQEFVRRAFERVRRGIAAATQGKQNMKDCVVVETYLEATRTLRGLGFDAPVLFLTTNSGDFSQSGSDRNVHSDLDPEFSNAGLTYASNFLAARYDRGVAAWETTVHSC